MTRLTASERAKFACVDSKGRRRLPIHDEAHVRNALSRFERVSFEDDAAREPARKRLLTAAKKYGMASVGFMASQLRLERGHNVSDLSSLPTGSVTFLMTDIEGSTALLQRLGERHSTLLTDVRRVIRRSVQNSGRYEVRPCRRVLRGLQKVDRGRLGGTCDPAPAARAGVVGGRQRAGPRRHPRRSTHADGRWLRGLTVHTVARVCAAAHGGQILVSSRTKAAVSDTLPPASVSGVGAASTCRASRTMRVCSRSRRNAPELGSAERLARVVPGRVRSKTRRFMRGRLSIHAGSWSAFGPRDDEKR
jgi:class 3 adenylate cyclase